MLLLLLPLFSAPFAQAQAKVAQATFAGGCYWCMEDVFDHVEGVISAASGFAGGLEAVDVAYDPEKVTYEELLEVFWKNIDPTDAGGQFCDRGPQYRSGIFYYTRQQKALAEKSAAEIERILNQKVETPILQAMTFSAGREQDFYKTSPIQYKQYKLRCGRARRLQELWGTKKDQNK